MSVQTDPVPPVPEHTPPVQEDANTSGLERRFNHTWTRWFVSLREKVNVINETVASLSSIISGGFVAIDNGEAVARTITGTSGRINVTNGNGVSGDPTIDLDTTGVTAGAKSGGINTPSFTFDVYGRLTSESPIAYTSDSSASAGSATALPATPAGYITVSLNFGSGPVPVKIPYFDP